MAWTGRLVVAVALLTAAVAVAPAPAAAGYGHHGWRRHHHHHHGHRHGHGRRHSHRHGHGRGRGHGHRHGHGHSHSHGGGHRNNHGHKVDNRGHQHPNDNDDDGSRDRERRLANHGWDRQWRSGRATWYGGPDDPSMNEDEGSCLNQGYIKRPVHAYYSAPSDVSVFYPDQRCQYPNPHGWWYAPLCPRTKRTCRDVCMQLRCKAKYNTWSQLAYGKQVEAEMCKGYKSVVVQLTDTCPHNHPQNVIKKHNWCSAGHGGGGRKHIDISYTAWDTIVQRRDVGVIHMEWRIVDCSVGVGAKGWDQDVYQDVWQG